MNHKFYPQQRTALGQSQYSSADCPSFYLEAEAGPGYVPAKESSHDPLSAIRGMVWGLIFVSPFWMLGILAFLYFMK